MVKVAVYSDIHGNHEAFRRVVQEIATEGPLQEFFLGDLVGYGPEPRECLEYMRDRQDSMTSCLTGNHDYAALNPETMKESGWNYAARESMGWTVDELKKKKVFGGRKHWEMFRKYMEKARWDIESSMFDRIARFGHAAPQVPAHFRYVFGTHMEMTDHSGSNPFIIDDVYTFMEEKNIDVCFVGHSHYPFFSRKRNGFIDYFRPKPGAEIEVRKNDRIIVNAGSVGQPRDRDPRACLVLWEGDKLTFKRVSYDVEATQRKLRGAKSLAKSTRNGLADRLGEGR